MRRCLAALALTPLLLFAAPDDKLPPDLALVPHDALWFATVRAADVGADARVKALLTMATLPADPIKEIERLGVNLADVERVTFFQRRVSQGFPVAVIRSSKALDRAAILKRLSATLETTLHGRKVFASPDNLLHQPAISFADDKTALIGMPAALVPALAALAGGGKDHPMADELKVAAGKHSLVAAIRPGLLTRTLDAELPVFGGPGVPDLPKAAPPIEKKDTPPAVPPDKVKDGFVRLVLAAETKIEDLKDAPLRLRTLKEITEGDVRADGSMWGFLAASYPPLTARMAIVTFDLGDTLKATMKAEFDNEEDAEDSELLARYALFAIRRQGPVFLRMGLFQPETIKTLAPLVKQTQEAVRAAVVKRTGKTLTGSISGKLDLTPLVKFVATEKPVSDDANNLKMIGLAFHNYHDTYGYMIRAICDKGGKPLLSWRVAILPYIDQEKLYKEFKLDEPWDSPHNKKLIAKMPKIFAGPPVKAGDPEPASNTTAYQVFMGPGTMFPKPDSKTRLTDITDGTSNTFLVAEANKPVIWTKPDDIAVVGKTFPKLGGRFEKFFHVLMGDGSVKKVKIKADEKVLSVWISPNDGMIVNEKDLEP